jgi:hypothetical protein
MSTILKQNKIVAGSKSARRPGNTGTRHSTGVGTILPDVPTGSHYVHCIDTVLQEKCTSEGRVLEDNTSSDGGVSINPALPEPRSGPDMIGMS